MRPRLIPLIALFALPALALQAATYSLDQAHTDVAFKIRHMGLSKVRGNFHTFSGTVQYDGHPASLQVEARIEIDSIDTGNEKRDEHLLNEDFFDAGKHPLMTFKSRKVEKAKDGYVLVGDITIKGVTKPVRLDLEVTGPVDSPMHPGTALIGLNLEGELPRHDFGVSNEGRSDKMIGKTVYLEISAEAKK